MPLNQLLCLFRLESLNYKDNSNDDDMITITIKSNQIE